MAVDWGYEFYEESYSIPNNTSTVRLKIWIDVSGSSYNYNWQDGVIWFQGENWRSYQLPPNSRTEVFNETRVWGHDAQTGQGTAAFACELPTTPSGGTKGVGDTYLTLTTIPRKTSISNYTLTTVSETALKVTWGAADTVDYVWWSKDNGSNWTGVDVTDGTSGNFNITGLTPRSKL